MAAISALLCLHELYNVHLEHKSTNQVKRQALHN